MSILIMLFLLSVILIGVPKNIHKYSLGDYAILLLFSVGLIFLALKLWKSSIVNSTMKSSSNTLRQKIEKVGAISEPPATESPLSILLKPNEICHFQTQAQLLMVKNQVVGHTGGSSGASVRIAKGLTIRSGGYRGTSIRKDVSYFYPGLLTITNQRFIMTGEKGFEDPIDNLTAFSPYNGYAGITLQFGSHSHTLIMNEPYWIPKIWDLLHECQNN